MYGARDPRIGSSGEGYSILIRSQLVCWLLVASSLVIVIILGSKGKKEKRGRGGEAGKRATMLGISQSVHGSWRIYLQPKTKNSWEEGMKKKKIQGKRNY